MNLLTRATRNASILNWWADCEPAFTLAVRILYAQSLGCPTCEVGSDREFAQDAETLDWLALHYPHTIAAHQDDLL